jgi:hypothetical protein
VVEALATRALERAIVRSVTEATSLAGVPSMHDVAPARRDGRRGR